MATQKEGAAPASATPQVQIEYTSDSDSPPPAISSEVAFHGILGSLVKLVAPHTAGDKQAIYMCALTALGGLAGLNPESESKQEKIHEFDSPRLFTCLVGETGSKKGTAWKAAQKYIVDPVLEELVERGHVDASHLQREWIQTGISSGEGIVKTFEQPRQFGEDGDPLDVAIKPVNRLIVLSEIGVMLQNIKRQDSTTAEKLIELYDGVPMAVPTRKDPLRAPNPYGSMITMGTPESWVHGVPAEHLALNGFFNRFLFVPVVTNTIVDIQDIKLDPTPAMKKLVSQLAEQVATKRLLGQYWFTEEARDYLNRYLSDHSVRLATSGGGFRAALLSRNATHLVRISLAMSLLDLDNDRPDIDRVHMEAAEHWVRRSNEGMRWVWGVDNRTRDEQKVYDYLENQPEYRAKRSEISSKVLQNNKSTRQMDFIAKALKSSGDLEIYNEKIKGTRRFEWWVLKETS